ncbi:TolC family protein [Pelomonas aquatica]|jgi:outer membrane protein TolC|uniref:TolC family protein n=3 Tax=Bacteria TaxID=2 RepID=A0A9X4LCY9_9BURK|nr:TolC family protein [Pelomonas aquatica]MCY4754334.1 TolC family protein [Pelomonas aquatica]MDG0861616.1 TolC family protein [Pelomonas aquatica]
MKRLAARFIACAWLCVTLSARAEDVPTPGFLPSTAQASAWIEADPAVASARLAAEAANHGGAAIAAGPHEWTARVQGQRRSYQDSGARSNEWTAALERAIRVNGKAGLDRQLRDLEVELGRARLGEARHEAARTLADAWTGVIVAKRQHALLRDQLAIAMSNLDVVTKRQRAGDASALDSNVAQGDIGSIARDVSQAATEVVKAEATLRVRFAAVVPDGIVLPPPQTPVWPEAQWRERVLEEADPIKTAETEWRRAGVTAARARADRIADPTVGVFAANEAMRNERVVGLSISIPFGGSYRSARALQAGKETDALQAALDQTRREIELEAAQTYAEATGSLERWRIASETARLSAESARLMQRAYGLGAADLQALLLARRQATDAARAAVQAQGEAVRWEMRLLIDAHLIWDLAQD